jgi:FKBP-type peptidyl-prolyl cis-trans isomerase
MRKTLTAIALGFLLIPAAHAQRERLSPDDAAYVENTWPQAKNTAMSIRYVIEKPGAGDSPKPGDLVYVSYVGTLLKGQEFDRNVDPEHPFHFRLGRHEVIRGWDIVIQDMKPGEKRMVVIPPELAYGTHGWLPKIPRDAALVFQIELLKVDRQ